MSRMFKNIYIVCIFIHTHIYIYIYIYIYIIYTATDPLQNGSWTDFGTRSLVFRPEPSPPPRRKSTHHNPHTKRKWRMVGKESGAGSLDPGLMSPRGPWARSRPWGCSGGCLPAASGAGAAAGAAAGGGPAAAAGAATAGAAVVAAAATTDFSTDFGYGFWYGFLLQMACAGLRILVRILVRTACAGLRILNGSWCGS